MNKFNSQAYLASTGRNLDKDGVFGNTKGGSGSGAKKAKQPKMNARDKLRSHRSLIRKLHTSTSIESDDQSGTLKAPTAIRSPLQSVSVNSPKGRKIMMTKDPSWAKVDKSSSRGIPKKAQGKDVNMRNLLTSAALHMQPSISSISPLQTTDHVASETSTFVQSRLIKRKGHEHSKVNRTGNSNGSTRRKNATKKPSDEYTHFLTEMTKEQHFRYNEVSDCSIDFLVNNIRTNYLYE